MNPASKAAAMAERARTRQNARSGSQATPTPTGGKETRGGDSRRSQWYVRKSCGTLVDVFFHPPVSDLEARAQFYPDAVAIFYVP